MSHSNKTNNISTCPRCHFFVTTKSLSLSVALLNRSALRSGFGSGAALFLGNIWESLCCTWRVRSGSFSLCTGFFFLIIYCHVCRRVNFSLLWCNIFGFCDTNDGLPGWCMFCCPLIFLCMLLASNFRHLMFIPTFCPMCSCGSFWLFYHSNVKISGDWIYFVCHTIYHFW